MKSIIRFCIAISLTLAFASAARAGTIVVSTTVYDGATPADELAISLPAVAAYIFDVVVKSSGTGTFASFDMHLEQKGISGEDFYLVNASSITQCTSACTRWITPDLYLGGDIRAWWTVVGASATVTVTARQLTP